MTKEKWLKIYNEECGQGGQIIGGQPVTKPELWKLKKAILENIIDNIDKATEVYEMENKEKA